MLSPLTFRLLLHLVKLTTQSRTPKMIRVLTFVIGLSAVTSALANPLYDDELLRSAPIEVFEKALEAGVSATSRPGQWSPSPLWMAVERERQDLAELLLKNGANINGLSQDNETVLFRATFSGTVGMMKFLLENGASVNTDQPPLTQAVRAFTQNPIEKTKLLLSYGADVNIVDREGETAITSAAENRYAGVKLMQLLLGKGADPLATDGRGLTPLTSAIQQGSIDSISYLLETFPNVLEDDKSRKPPLHYLMTGRFFKFAEISEFEAIVDLLLSAGADINEQDFSGNTILHLSVNEDSLRNDVVSFLVKRADVGLKNNSGKTAFDLAKGGLLLGYPEYFELEQATKASTSN